MGPFEAPYLLLYLQLFFLRSPQCHKLLVLPLWIRLCSGDWLLLGDSNVALGVRVSPQ